EQRHRNRIGPPAGMNAAVPVAAFRGSSSMRVIILGGGVIGCTSAYYLAKAGHEVTLLERQAGPGMETSFSNAGEISPGYASPWAGPGVPVKAIRWLLMRHGPLAIRPKHDPAMWRRMLQ